MASDTDARWSSERWPESAEQLQIAALCSLRDFEVAALCEGGYCGHVLFGVAAPALRFSPLRESDSRP